MRLIKYILSFAFLLLVTPCVFAQDVLPGKAEILNRAKKVRQAPSHSLVLDVALDTIVMPSSFIGVKKSVLVDNSNALHPFLEKLRLTHAGFLTDSIRVLHVGDSHVKGKFFTEKVGSLLQEDFPMLAYEEYGINGAVERTFNTPDRIRQIASFKPDLLVLSFGTNTCNDRNYSSAAHYRELESLILQIRQLLPDTPILLTTPPGAYERLARKKYKPNRRTDKAIDVVKKCAANYGLAYWDLYNIVGGINHAPTNWMNAKLMRPDHIHFFVEGYELQGSLLYKALIKHYNEYVTP